MPRRILAASFEDIGKAHEIARDITLGIAQAVAHPGLRREMDDRVRSFRCEAVQQRRLVGDIAALKPHAPLLRELRDPRLFQADVVIVGEIVDAGDLHSILAQPLRDVEAEKTGDARDQNFHPLLRPSPSCWRRRRHSHRPRRR